MTGGPGRILAAGATALVVLVVIVGAAAGGALGGILGGTGADILPSAGALAAIPAEFLSLYQQAADTCPGLPWTVLAAIGTVESSNGISNLPGVHSGANSAGAEVIYRWDGGLWYLRHETRGGRASLVSEGSLARGQGGGHSGFIGSPAHDDQISSMASGVSI